MRTIEACVEGKESKFMHMFFSLCVLIPCLIKYKAAVLVAVAVRINPSVFRASGVCCQRACTTITLG